MEQKDIWDAEAARSYDTPGTGMFDPALLAATAERLAALANGGAALEFAIGTGRVALPLHASGVPVAGIELSEAMATELRAKPEAAGIPVTIGDMTTTTVPGPFALVYLVYNTISNVLTQAGQVEIFRNVAGVNGLVMTKLDGTARGGILVAIAAKHRLPVYFIGVGEGIDDLEPFRAKDFAEAIAGTAPTAA